MAFPQRSQFLPSFTVKPPTPLEEEEKSDSPYSSSVLQPGNRRPNSSIESIGLSGNGNTINHENTTVISTAPTSVEEMLIATYEDLMKWWERSLTPEFHTLLQEKEQQSMRHVAGEWCQNSSLNVAGMSTPSDNTSLEEWWNNLHQYLAALLSDPEIRHSPQMLHIIVQTAKALKALLDSLKECQQVTSLTEAIMPVEVEILETFTTAALQSIEDPEKREFIKKIMDLFGTLEALDQPNLIKKYFDEFHLIFLKQARDPLPDVPQPNFSNPGDLKEQLKILLNYLVKTPFELSKSLIRFRNDFSHIVDEEKTNASSKFPELEYYQRIVSNINHQIASSLNQAVLQYLQGFSEYLKNLENFPDLKLKALELPSGATFNKEKLEQLLELIKDPLLELKKSHNKIFETFLKGFEVIFQRCGLKQESIDKCETCIRETIEAMGKNWENKLYKSEDEKTCVNKIRRDFKDWLNPSKMPKECIIQAQEIMRMFDKYAYSDERQNQLSTQGKKFIEELDALYRKYYAFLYP